KDPSGITSSPRTDLSRSLVTLPVIRARISAARTVDQLARYRGLGHAPAAHISRALHLGRRHSRDNSPAFHFHLQPQLIPWAHRTPKFSALDPGKHHHLIGAVLHFGEQQSPAGLGDRFHNQHSRHDRQSREMPGKKRLVDSYILDSDDALLALQLQHAVNQEKRIAMRKDAQDLV